MGMYGCGYLLVCICNGIYGYEWVCKDKYVYESVYIDLCMCTRVYRSTFRPEGHHPSGGTRIRQVINSARTLTE